LEEIRFHGRGGQGTVVAAVILAKAFFKAGDSVQTFPSFGVERRGAPVEAYLRIDREKILPRCNVYTPDHIIVQDRKLLRTTAVTKGLKPGGWILINAPAPPEGTLFDGFRLACVDATHIAVVNGLGTKTHPIVNTAITGAFVRIMGRPSLEHLLDAIKEEISVKTELNMEAARQAYEQVRFKSEN
jgi:pyruvate ferredoxin oxidoreductase gamma subunit/2-oxoisovalerate ferredoxin oxidoreductase gamma subunit